MGFIIQLNVTYSNNDSSWNPSHDMANAPLLWLLPNDVANSIYSFNPFNMTGATDLWTMLFDTIEPTVLYDGSHTVASLRQGTLKYGEEALLTLSTGWSASCNLFYHHPWCLIQRKPIVRSAPDSFVDSTSPDFANTSSWRVFLDPFQSIYYQVEIQNRSALSSAFGVISGLGGLFTVMSGVFAFFFGRSIVATITGMSI
jgi:hypothetical protein